MRYAYPFALLAALFILSGCDPETTLDDDDTSGDDDTTAGPVDADQDGYTDTTDCDDNDPLTFPGATELCDGLDNDCDDVVPEDELDGDGDGMSGCEGDCDDTDDTVYEGAEEVCDGLDNDCDGESLDDEIDDDGDGVSECEGDCNDEDGDIYPEAAEACNAIDDDCDLAIDEDFDGDGDTYTTCGLDGVSGTEDDDCDDGDASLNHDDSDADSFTSCDGDCNDADAAIHPDAEEACNGIDDDCDGSVPGDEVDSDGDTYLACEDCNDADAVLNHDDADLDGYSTCAGDCSDADAGLNPADADGDGFSTCQGDCDDADANMNLSDADSDGWDTCEGDCDDGEADLNLDDDDGDGVTTCDGDCDDANANTNPSAAEICDGLDNDCNGLLPVDESDSDGDGVLVCENDCDDGDAAVYDGAPDVCDEVLDNDCDGMTDPNEADDDGDGWTACDGDCDDGNSDVNPDAVEVCGDGIDNDCEGTDCSLWSLAFDGVDDRLEVLDAPGLDTPTSMTISAWVKPYSGSLDQPEWAYHYVGKGLDGDDTYSWAMGIRQSGNVLEFGLYDGVNNPVAVGSTALGAGVWYHTVGTYDGSVMRIYLDATLDGMDVYTVNIGDQASSIDMGKWPNYPRFFNGLMCEVALYGDALSEAEVIDLYTQGVDPTDPRLIALWPLDEGSGNVIYDESGNGYDGIIYGASWIEDVP